MARKEFSSFREAESAYLYATVRRQLALYFTGALALLVACSATFVAVKLLLTTSGKGLIDMAVVEPETRKVVIGGWVRAFREDVAVISLSIYLKDQEIYSGATDADDHSGASRPEWLNSRWRIVTPIPKTLRKGHYPLRVRAQLENGEEFELSNVQSTKEIEIP